MLIHSAIYLFAIITVNGSSPEGLAPSSISSPPQILRVPLIRSHKHSAQHEFSKRESFESKLYNDQGSQYLIEVGIGTPPQNFTVTLDTGSADLWVPSSLCPRSECPLGGFEESKSSTFDTHKNDFSIQYGIGSVNGTYVYDTVTIAGASVPNQQFGLAITTKSILFPTSNKQSTDAGRNSGGNIAANGILGLGYPRLTAAQNQDDKLYNPFVFNLVANKIIKNPVFSVYMNRASREGWAGEIIFGGADKTKYSGDLHYLPVAQLTSTVSPSISGYYYWMVYGQAIAITNPTARGGDEDKIYALSTPKQATTFILDTGTTLTYLPTQIASEIASSIAGANGYRLDRRTGVFLVDCMTAKKSPVMVQLQMSQSASPSRSPVVLSVPASELVLPVDANSTDSATACMLGIAPLGDSDADAKVGSNMLLIGDSVLRSAYLVFDIGQNRVGIAAANGVPGSVNGINASIISQGKTASDKDVSAAAAAILITSTGWTTFIVSFTVLLGYTDWQRSFPKKYSLLG
ncbi:aspartic peptidase domain-containing protein [Dichotomocladium elegans]|nr:aspartic peptidase domain-containing protein [Dichotomocladium elegans]